MRCSNEYFNHYPRAHDIRVTTIEVDLKTATVFITVVKLHSSLEYRYRTRRKHKHVVPEVKIPLDARCPRAPPTG
jgi:hypothetical protein